MANSSLISDKADEIEEKQPAKANQPFQAKFKTKYKNEVIPASKMREMYTPLQRIEGYADQISAQVAAKKISDKVREVASKQLHNN